MPLTMALDGGVDERTLVERLQARDPRALAELYDRYGGALYAQLLHTTGMRILTEDLVLETFVRAWNQVRTFNAGSPLEAWLLAIARDTATRWEDSDTSTSGTSASQTHPSPKLRRRILAAAGLHRIGWAPFFGCAAVMAISAAVYFGGRERAFAIENLQLREQMRLQNVALTRFNNALSILNGDSTTAVPFASGSIRGKVFVNARQGVLLIASNLTPAPQGKVYEMWLIDKHGKATPAGLFQVRPDGATLYPDRGSVDVASIASVGITLENENGAAQPGGPFLVNAPLP